MPVQLIIKSAAQSVEDFTLNCEMSWTILQVKDEISNLYPTKPKREHQRLIYGGKLLLDDLPLTSVLNQIQDVHVLHLVCPIPSVSEADERNNTKEKSVSSVCAGTPPLNPAGVYPELNQQILTSNLTSGVSVVPGVAFNPPSDAVQQYLAMQQMYTQFMTRYFSQYNGSVPYVPTNTVTPPVQQQPTVAPRQNAPQQLRQVEGEEEDYIDNLYALVRGFMLTTLLFYYSSVTRVIAVTLMVLLVTIFARINRWHRREELQRATYRRQMTEDAVTEQVQADNQNSDNESVPGNSADTETTPPETPNTLSVPSTIITLVKAFFSSLVPSDPLPVNVN